MLNTGVSGLLGLAFWLVAARYYTEAAVGQGSAAIAAMKLLAGLTALTLTGALTRFLPVAGRGTGRLVFRTYAGSSAVVAVAASVFLLTLDLWGPSYRFLHGPLSGLGFVLAVVGWSLLTLQDGVLTGLRSALWVPVGNLLFSAAKLGLLVVFAAALPTAGVFVAWVVAIAASVIPLGRLVFRRLVPRHARATERTARPPSLREIGRFLAGDYTGSLFSLAVVHLVPVLVASQVSASDNAYFYITATIGSTVNLLAVNMGASLTVEGAHDPARMAQHTRAALLRMARIMLPACLFLFVFAPYLLGVFGPGYAEAATPLLRWFAVGAVLRVVMEVYFAVLRAQSRTTGLAYMQGLLCALVLGLTLMLLPRMGLAGAGVAEVCALTPVVWIAAGRLRRVLRGHPYAPLARIPRGSLAPDGDLADLAVYGDLGDGDLGDGGLRDRGLGDGVGAYGAGPRVAAAAPRREAPRAAPAPRAVLPHHVEPAVWVLLAAALALVWLPLRGMDDADLDRMTGLGLISVLPAATLTGVALLVTAFGCALALPRPRRALLTATLLLTVAALHTLPALLETEPRFPTAWQHLGFLDYLGRTGSAVPDLDARWSWPGFFAAARFVAGACGITDFTEVLRWWPLVLQLLCLPPLFLLLRAIRAGWRAKWCAVWLFALCGWVGQDYFSPQGFTYLLYLAFVAIVLVWFRETAPAADRGRLALLLGVLIALFAASVAAHQLTPFVMLGVLAALVLVRRCTLRGLPLLLAVMVASWVGFLAEPYWSGHFDELFGGLGGLGGNVSSSVTDRIGGDGTHQLVLYTRVALAGAVLALACWGVLRRRAAGFTERPLLALTFVPFLALGMQSYGGEMALRVFLFALPGACVLAALALFPRVGGSRTPGAASARRRPGLGPLAALLAGMFLAFGFLVARWGNEPFERVRPGEVAAMEYVYAHDRPTVRLLWLTDDPVESVTPALPWGAEDMERVRYEPVLAPRKPALVTPVVTALRNAGPRSYLIVNHGQSESLRLDAGYGNHWEQRLRTALDGRPELRRVLSNEHAAVYEAARPPAGEVPAPRPGPAGPQVTWTPWSVTGALAALAAMLVLAAREALRVAGPPGPRRQRRLRGTFWLAVPPLLVFLASLIHRFTTMS
ncbi:lipopolysaccharide biosynthesis protein [Streptomyces piniterrae]|uniref:Lipopolysaccharide biosynthesis protein n=2 Tax=Streptomyces piniterrae TaxID=2571125 RepID=A0A4U0MRR3_9ACTN|nr:polysaccharide biosynthesis C-terminal domain-containing protein [Streptomyces piniterrae]TJZ43607.1 lipopolysaccharide biosynthesis protein [Streptomyces piniterrae]